MKSQALLSVLAFAGCSTDFRPDALSVGVISPTVESMEDGEWERSAFQALVTFDLGPAHAQGPTGRLLRPPAEGER